MMRWVVCREDDKGYYQYVQNKYRMFSVCSMLLWLFPGCQLIAKYETVIYDSGPDMVASDTTTPQEDTSQPDCPWNKEESKCAGDGGNPWEWVYPLVQANDLFGIWGVEENATGTWNVFAVGRTGTVLRKNGAASNWEPAFPSCKFPNVDFFGVWGTAVDDVYVVGSNSAILHFDNPCWTRMEIPVNPPDSVRPVLRAIHGNGEYVFAVGENGVVLSLNKNDQSPEWEYTSTRPNEDKDLYGVWVTEDHVFVVGDATACKRALASETWECAREAGVLHAVTGVGEEIYMAGNGGLWKWEKTAVDPQLEEESSFRNYLESFGVPPTNVTWGTLRAHNNELFLGGETEPQDRTAAKKGYVVRYSLEGLGAVVGHRELRGVRIKGIWGTSTTDLFVAGEHGTVLHYNAHEIMFPGEEGDWTPESGNFVQHLNDIWGSEVNNIYAVGEDEVVISTHCNDGSTLCKMDRTSSGQDLKGVTGASINGTDIVYAVGTGGTILNCTPEKCEFSQVNSRVVQPINLNAIWSDTSGTRPEEGTRFIAVGSKNDRGIVLKKGESVENWQEMFSAGPVQLDVFQGRILEDVWGHSDTLYFVGRENSGLLPTTGFVMKGTGTDISEEITGIGKGLFAVWGESKEKVLVAGAEGMVGRWTSSSTGFEDAMIKWPSVADVPTMYGVWGKENNTGTYDVVVVGDDGTILELGIDGNWRASFSGTHKRLMSTKHIGDFLYIVGESGTILRRKVRQ
ncbi:MAG: hypothetical protein V1754_07030 [Pseudomonadota bacterium]